MPNKHRHGKLADGGHSTALQGLKAFLSRFETWPEVDRIQLGRVHRRSVGGGDLKFTVTRWAFIGQQRTGVKCVAARGAMAQDVVLTSRDPDALKRKLQLAGYARW